MVNLTLSIDDGVLKQARIRALEGGTSVNAIVREYLTEFADPSRTNRAVTDFLAIADRASAGSGDRGRDWTRDELYAGRLDDGSDRA